VLDVVEQLNLRRSSGVVNPWNLQRLPAEVGAVDQEQDPSRVRVLDQPVADVGGGECLARPNKEALPRKVANIPASDSVSGPQDRMNVATTRVASSVLQTQVAELQGFLWAVLGSNQ
jgi:hypothetical protein